MKGKFQIILLVICVATFTGSWAFGQDKTQQQILQKLQELGKTAQNTLDRQEIENLMGIYALQNKGSVKPGDSDFRETIAEKTQGVCYARDSAYLYGDAAKKAMHGLDDPTLGKAGTLKVHLVTTGHIQIAEDGLTAKAAFYSPGFLTEVGTDGKAKSAWDYKRYGVDFIKEGGKWRIWHMAEYTDFVTPPNVSWTEKVSIPNTTIKYRPWSLESGSQNRFKVPAPYKTFSETFSYCPAEGSKN